MNLNDLDNDRLLENLPFISAVRAFYKAKENVGLSYHNWNHSLTTALRAVYLYDNNSIYELNNVFIAGLFHDIGYNKYNKHDSLNVINACALFDQFYNQILNDTLIDYHLNEQDIDRIHELILATQFPHKHTEDLACQALQDADLTQNWTRPVQEIVTQLADEDYPNPSLDFPTNEMLNTQLAKSINDAVQKGDTNNSDFERFYQFYTYFMNQYDSYGLTD